MKREIDEGRTLEKVARRLQDEGQATSQRLHDWKREPKIPRTPDACSACDGTGLADGRTRCDDCQGTGDAPSTGGNRDGKLDQQAARMAARWTHLRLTILNAAAELEAIMDAAKANHQKMLDKHRTPAQVVADGWCGQHWRLIGELEPITLRPTGEPFYSDKCRWCGDNKPTADMLKARHSGKPIRVAAS